MISRSDFLEECYRRADVRGAFEHLFWRAFQNADVPDKSVDFWGDLKLCLNKAIHELCDARNDI